VTLFPPLPSVREFFRSVFHLCPSVTRSVRLLSFSFVADQAARPGLDLVAARDFMVSLKLANDFLPGNWVKVLPEELRQEHGAIEAGLALKLSAGFKQSTHGCVRLD
jgi:hypothetical protein